MKRRALLMAAVYSLLMSCTHDARSADASGSASLVTSALEAQLDAAMCSPILALDTLRDWYFRGVTLVRGTGICEQGDTVSRIVGVDRSGVVYTLDSPSSFRWLVSRHPPAAIDSNEVGTYAVLALSLIGHIDARARVVRAASDLPSEVSAQISPERARSLSPAIYRNDPKLANLSLTTFDGLSLIVHDVTLHRRTGAVSSLDERVWQAKRIH